MLSLVIPIESVAMKSETMNKKYFVTPQGLEDFCVQAMLRAGMSEKDARVTAKVLVQTDMWGTFTHGSKQVRGLMKNYRDGRMNIDAGYELIAKGPK